MKQHMVCIILSTLDEEESIGKVIDEIPRQGGPMSADSLTLKYLTTDSAGFIGSHLVAWPSGKLVRMVLN